MPLVAENWPNLDRWKTLSLGVGGGGAIAAGGRLTANAQNPIFQLKQPFTNFPVIDVRVNPHDDLQIYFTEQAQSIDFANLSNITYFGIYYELNFGGFMSQFFLMRRLVPGGPLVSLPIFTGAPDTEYRILLGATSTHYYAKVFSAAGAELYSSGPIDLFDSGAMSLLVNPGRNTTPPPQPWIGELKVAWGLSEADVLASMTAGQIVVPPLVAPVIPSQPTFYEGVYGSWTSPAIQGSGTYQYELQTSLPPGLVLSTNGAAFTISGRVPVGSAGVWPVKILVDDGFQETELEILLDLSVLPAHEASYSTVSPAAEVLGDFYYLIAGGPLRKEANP